MSWVPWLPVPITPSTMRLPGRGRRPGPGAASTDDGTMVGNPTMAPAPPAPTARRRRRREKAGLARSRVLA